MIRPAFFTDEVAEEFEVAVQRGAAAGAQGLELRSRLFGRSIEDLSEDDVRRIQDIAAKYHVQVAVLASPFGKCSHRDPAGIARHHRIFEHLVKRAQQFGTPLIRGFAFWNPHGSERQRPDLAAYLDAIVAFLKPAVQRAEDAGVTLCLETEGATMGGTCAEIRRIIEALGPSPALQVAWDVHNAWHCGEEPLPDGYAQVRGWVRHVHVKPNAARSLATVAGSATSYRQVFQALLEDGYDGWASIEHWGRPEDMLSGLRQLVALLEEMPFRSPAPG
jgi:sugar phosphate isomerase/epimerase